ncbi:hypothetical protein MKW92_049819 [Papaver armeniacum]|nr:hypothetical protein MKW92_049819 [Papaver armeniacum]
MVIVRPQFLTGEDTKGLCPSIPWIEREGRAVGFSCCQRVEQLVFRVVKELNNENNGECLIELIGSCRNKNSLVSSPQGKRTRGCLGRATRGFGEIVIGEHSNWGGLTT